MDQDTEVYIELADDEHPDADAAAEDTARLLMEVNAHRCVRQSKNKSVAELCEAKQVNLQPGQTDQETQWRD